jgi:hypothetical protein
MRSTRFFRRHEEGSTMARPKQASKRKGRRTTLPFVGAAGVSLAMAGGASATAPTTKIPSQDTAPLPAITLGEEEISDVSLGTFYVFDREDAQIPFGQGLQLARRGCGGCGCRGCAARGCGGCGGGGCAVRAFRGCGGCGCRGCGVRIWRGCGGCGGCGCATCLLWAGWGWVYVC